MVLNGFCRIQEKNYTIGVDIKDANCLEDLKRDKYVVGRIDCKYAIETGKCNGYNCSVLEQNGIKR